jgi:hypothetical protein
MLVSNFVTNELSDSNIQVNSAEVVVLSTDDEWDFLNDLRKRKQALGPGELGAITVAKFRAATLLSNDRQAPFGCRRRGNTHLRCNRRLGMRRGNGKHPTKGCRRNSRRHDPRGRLDFRRTARTLSAKNPE